MKKLMWRIMTVLIVLISWVLYSHPDWVVDPPAMFGTVSALSSDKCYTDCTDPNRPSFDQWGNEFDWQGNLINAASCTTDPISKQPNPYSCTAPVTQSTVSDTPAVNPAAAEANAPDFQGK